MDDGKAIVYPEERKLCIGCYHQRPNYSYDIGQLNNRLLGDHPKCKYIQFVESI